MAVFDSEVVCARSLREARRRLVHLEEVCLEDEGDVPPWLIAANYAVKMQLREVESDEG